MNVSESKKGSRKVAGHLKVMHTVGTHLLLPWFVTLELTEVSYLQVV